VWTPSYLQFSRRKYLVRITFSSISDVERIATFPFANPANMVAVTLSSTTLTSRAALTRPKSTKRHARLAVRVHAKLETENDTADKEGVADATEKGGFLSGVNNVIKSIWPGSDVANAFNDFGNAKSNPAAKIFDADTMSEAERDALKRQYSQPTGLLAALFPVRCEFCTFAALFSRIPQPKKNQQRNETNHVPPHLRPTSLTPPPSLD
jgi:hypothetical protein